MGYIVNYWKVLASNNIEKVRSCNIYEVTKHIPLFQVTVVGLVRSVKESSTRLDYEIDDLTGPPLEVKQFVDNDVSIGAGSQS